MSYDAIKLTLGVFVTIGLYSVLFRENKLYRFVEHMFLGLAAGWALVALWTETLKDNWYTKIIGEAGVNGTPGTPGNWAYILLLPIGLMGYFVFSKKHNWMSRVPIGIILGLWSGQQIQVWFNRYGAQIVDSARPIIPNDMGLKPSTVGMTQEQAGIVDNTVYLSTAISNFIFVATLLCVLSYFLFSVDIKNRFLKGMTTSGRMLLMVGFGAIFGSTVMMRFSLLIDRMYFVWVEWFYHTILGRGG